MGGKWQIGGKMDWGVGDDSLQNPNVWGLVGGPQPRWIPRVEGGPKPSSIVGVSSLPTTKLGCGGY